MNILNAAERRSRFASTFHNGNVGILVDDKEVIVGSSGEGRCGHVNDPRNREGFFFRVVARGMPRKFPRFVVVLDNRGVASIKDKGRQQRCPEFVVVRLPRVLGKEESDVQGIANMIVKRNTCWHPSIIGTFRTNGRRQGKIIP